MFPAALSTSFAFMLPAAAPPNAKAFSYGYVKVRDMVRLFWYRKIVHWYSSFSKGGGGLMLIPIETHSTCDFLEGGL